MKKSKPITFVHEPTDLQCGQAVLAMATGLEVEAVAEELNNRRETNLKEMKRFLQRHGVWISDERKPVQCREELPQECILSLETPRCWHWSLYSCGVFYDPEHGVMEDFPDSSRRYFWEIRRDGATDHSEREESFTGCRQQIKIRKNFLQLTIDKQSFF